MIVPNVLGSGEGERGGFYMVAVGGWDGFFFFQKEFSVLHFISIDVCLIIHVNAILNKNIITKKELPKVSH